jgi:Zn-dependent M16 (insulinase) family peptidase
MVAAATELAELQSALLSMPAANLVRVAGDICALGSDAFGPWRRGPFLGAATVLAPAPQPKLPRELFAADALRPDKGRACGCLISSSAEESNYWSVQCDSFSDPRSPELAPLLVAIEYITALEGPWWRKIRGRGLSYSYSLSHSLGRGVLSFGLFKATDPVAAFKVAKGIIQQLCAEAAPGSDAADKADGGEEGDDEEGLDASAVEAAQSGVLFGLIEPVDTLPKAMGESFDNMLDRKPPDQLHWLLKEVQDVTEEAVRAALKRHVLPLFTGDVGRTVSIACPAQKREKIVEGLASLEPPFDVVQFDVDAFVTALSPSNGFAALRTQVRSGTEKT